MLSHEDELTIRRLCAARGIRDPKLSVVEAVKLLAREHAARTTMVAVLERQTRHDAEKMREAGMFTSEPIPGVQSPFYAGGRYFANAEDARRERAALALEENDERVRGFLFGAACARLATAKRPAGGRVRA